MNDDWLGLLRGGFGSPRMVELVSWRARVSHMLRVEAALARALARVGLLDDGDADAVTAVCSVDRLDLDELAARSPAASTPVTALLQVLRADAGDRVLDALHGGATSQDVIDTAMTLAIRDGLDLLTEQLLAAGDRLAELADTHRSTLAAGRTLGQHAVPITHGLRFARWLGALDRHVKRLDGLRDDVLVLQLGGAAGTLAAWGESGLDVATALADELALPVPDLPWHAERDRIATLAGQLAALVGTITTIAAELVQLARTEVAEVLPGDGGGSSAMPHKRNPTDATAARAAARLARAELAELTADAPAEHERAAGTWQAEWVLLPSALVRTAGALERLLQCLQGCEVDADRSRENLARGHWLVLTEALQNALIGHVGRAAAAEITAAVADEAMRTRTPLPEIAADHDRVIAALDPADLARALDPTTGLPTIHALVDRALATHRRAVDQRP